MFGPKNSSEFLFVKHGNLLKDVFVLLSGTFGTKHITGSHQRKRPYSFFYTPDPAGGGNGQSSAAGGNSFAKGGS